MLKNMPFCPTILCLYSQYRHLRVQTHPINQHQMQTVELKPTAQILAVWKLAPGQGIMLFQMLTSEVDAMR